MILCTKHKAQSTKHKAQSTKHKAQSTKHKALLICSIILWITSLGSRANQDSAWVIGRLIDVHGNPIKNAEIFIGQSTVIQSNEEGVFKQRILKNSENITLTSFGQFPLILTPSDTIETNKLGDIILIPRLFGPHGEPFAYPYKYKVDILYCPDISQDKKNKQTPLGKYIFYDSNDELFSTVTFMREQQIEVQYLKDSEWITHHYVLKNHSKLEFIY